MTDRLRFEPFDRARHDRSRFDCGVPDLNDYLRNSLGQHSRRSLTRGYVLVAPDGEIAGYFTLSASRIMVSVMPDRRGLPARMPLPATLVGRLAVDLNHRGQGLGGALLVEALRLAVEMSKTIASAAIEVEARDESARSFYARHGFKSLTDDRLHMYLPMATARLLVEAQDP